MLVLRRLLMAALFAAVALPGCGGAAGALGGGESRPNATDAAFARAMGPHQRRTGTLSGVAGRRAFRTELRALARKALARNDLFVQGLVGSADELRRRGVSPVGGKIGEPPPVDPRSLRGGAFSDLEVLEQLIRQHEFAVAASSAELAHGGDRTLKSLARMIHDSSRRDLAMLRRWLRTWYGKEAQPGVPPGGTPGVPPGPPPGGGGGPSPGPPV